MTFAENIVAVYEQATPNEIIEGMNWYPAAHELALELSPGDVWRGAGVIAALSPMKQWPLNVRYARHAFETGIATGNVTQHNEKAQRILDGEFALDVLNGQKTRAFASAIADPAGSTIATIDRHAHDVAMGRVFADKERKIGKRLFNKMSAHYVEASYELNVPLAALQAITWVTWKRMKGLK